MFAELNDLGVELQLQQEQVTITAQPSRPTRSSYNHRLKILFQKETHFRMLPDNEIEKQRRMIFQICYNPVVGANLRMQDSVHATSP